MCLVRHNQTWCKLELEGQGLAWKVDTNDPVPSPLYHIRATHKSRAPGRKGGGGNLLPEGFTVVCMHTKVCMQKPVAWVATRGMGKAVRRAKMC